MTQTTQTPAACQRAPMLVLQDTLHRQKESKSPLVSTTRDQPWHAKCASMLAWHCPQDIWLACMAAGAGRACMPCPGAAQAVKALSASHMSRVCCRVPGAAAAE